jgi:16S rRNA (cytidine1402-2'-O)-methyltransferase
MGELYVVATPIGNLKDFTMRAVEVLKSVDIIACEDTRHSARLMEYYDIRTPLQSYHEHNERQKAEALIEGLRQGKSIALISDAGTPLISDPGYHLVRLAHEADIRVVPVPGASALIAALSVSGLSSDRFVFEGFLPSKSNARQKRLAELSEDSRTVIFYESTHRILACVDDLIAIMGGDRPAAIARELTKNFESLYNGPLASIRTDLLADVHQIKGEFVVLIQGLKDEVGLSSELTEKAKQLLLLLAKELPPKKAASITAQVMGENKSSLYQYLISKN